MKTGCSHSFVSRPLRTSKASSAGPYLKKYIFKKKCTYDNKVSFTIC